LASTRKSTATNTKQASAKKKVFAKRPSPRKETDSLENVNYDNDIDEYASGKPRTCALSPVRATCLGQYTQPMTHVVSSLKQLPSAGKGLTFSQRSPMRRTH